MHTEKRNIWVRPEELTVQSQTLKFLDKKREKFQVRIRVICKWNNFLEELMILIFICYIHYAISKLGYFHIYLCLPMRSLNFSFRRLPLTYSPSILSLAPSMQFAYRVFGLNYSKRNYKLLCPTSRFWRWSVTYQ